MHIPDNYLSASTCAILALAAAPAWIHSVKKTTRDFPRERISAIGVAAAFSFLAMMFNVPLPGGTTGHAVGGTLLAVLLGPEAACLALTVALAVQAFVFGDGGILSFGANCFNMAVVLPFVGYYSYLGLRKLFRASDQFRKRDLLALAIGSYVGINVSALVAAVEFGLQPLFFHDANGQALYCPYDLSTSLPAMAIGHLTLFGLAEVVFTLVVYSFVQKTAPEFFSKGALVARDSEENAPRSKFTAVYLLLIALIVATPLGLLADGTAWGEWGADEIAETTVNGEALGYAPSGMTNGFEWNALVPDYSTPGLPDWLGYVLSAVGGVAALIVFFKLATLFATRNGAVADR